MSTAASPLSAAAPALRPAWGTSFLAAALGVLAGGLASAAIIGATVVAVSLAGGGPVEDAVGNALRPLSVFIVVPIAVAVMVDAACRREVFWLVTGRRPTARVTLLAALIAPAAAIGIGWRGGVIAYVLGVSTVLLRCSAEPTAATPRWFLAAFAARSRGVIVATAAAAVLVAATGLLAFQIATPALKVSPVRPTSGSLSPRSLQIDNRSLADVTVLGIAGPLAQDVRFGGGSSPPFVLARGEGRTISLVPAPGCRRFSASFSSLEVRYRILGVERISFLDQIGRASCRERV